MRRTLIFLLLMFLVFSAAGYSSPQNTTLPLPGADGDSPVIPSQAQKDMEKKANLQRQTDLKRDTEKLLKLSTELKEYVDKTNENVMSLEVIKKADEIEKLAHSVKTKMRGD